MIKSQPGSRSIGWGWEHKILPGRKDPRNCVNPRNCRKLEWDQKMGKIKCSFRIDWQSEKKRRNSDCWVICKATRGIDAGRGVIRHRGVSDGSDGWCPLWRSYSAQTEMFLLMKSRDVERVQDAGSVFNTGGKENGGVGEKIGFIYSSSYDFLVQHVRYDNFESYPSFCR